DSGYAGALSARRAHGPEEQLRPRHESDSSSGSAVLYPASSVWREVTILATCQTGEKMSVCLPATEGSPASTDSSARVFSIGIIRVSVHTR
ncbi:hypothetical protein KI387_020984, partial [Taxus chinensis]